MSETGVRGGGDRKSEGFLMNKAAAEPAVVAYEHTAGLVLLHT